MKWFFFRLWFLETYGEIGNPRTTHRLEYRFEDRCLELWCWCVYVSFSFATRRGLP